MSDREIRALEATPRTMALLFYGAGLRILECARLPIKDVDFDRRLLTLQDTSRGDWREPRQTARSAARRAKGATESTAGRGRVTMLPEAARNPLGDQIRYARGLYDADRSADAPGVQLSHPLEWKGKKAPTAWEWFWGF